MDTEQKSVMDFAEQAAALGFAVDEFVDLLEIFVATSSEDIDQLRTAIDAGAMTVAAAAAHSIKGAARGFGFDELARRAEALEMQARGQGSDQIRDILADLETRLAEIGAALQGYR